MQEQIELLIDEQLSPLKNKKLLVAVSGGIDSVVLTHLLHKQKNIKISIAHCNFKLRGHESNLDEQFVRELAKKVNCKIYVKEFKTLEIAKRNKQSIQIAARDLRYNWFEKIIKDEKLDFLVTAHHANDSLETFLINLTRGSGLAGLTGIPKRNKHIFRPLLTFTRDQIASYAIRHQLKWREDKSNNSLKYIRNKIRHQVVPILEEINPNLIEGFIQTSIHLKSSSQIICDNIGELKKQAFQENGELIIVHIGVLLELSNLNSYMFELFKDYNVTQWDNMYELLSAQSGKKIITSTHEILKDRSTLIISDNKKNNNKALDVFLIDKNTTEIIEPIQLQITRSNTINREGKNQILIDKNSIRFPLSLRKRKKGDVFYPTKMKGKKKLSKFFKDEKLSNIEKDNVWLLCSGDDIVWVTGMRQDRRYLPKNNKNILKITIL